MTHITHINPGAGFRSTVPVPDPFCRLEHACPGGVRGHINRASAPGRDDLEQQTLRTMSEESKQQGRADALAGRGPKDRFENDTDRKDYDAAYQNAKSGR